MSKQTLYLKFRPSQLEDVVGQKFTTSTLKQASISDKFAHAYVFSGNKGCGKTTTARILANLLTCEDVKDGKLCGKCRACQTIKDGMAMDVIELDCAANGNVENVQALIEGANWSPTELKRKVYILDECHQLTARAVSALLKIVEEPPEYLVFIFCTTEAKKIPATILSRAQRFNFKKLTSKDIVERLSYIAKQENIIVTEPALFEIAKISRGCLRDAIVPLEQIATIAANKEITETHVQKYFGLADRQGIVNIISSMADGNMALVLDQVNDLVVASVDVEAIAYEITEAFRNIMILKAQNGKTGLIDLPDHEIEKLKKLGEVIKLGQLDKLAQLFSNIKKELEFSINDRWILESTLIHGTALLRKTQ
jgi:DNA polymerase III subunit gamma/tau